MSASGRIADTGWLGFYRLQCPLWVTSGRSVPYHASVCFRAYSGHSESIFQKSLAERLLSPIAVIQVARIVDFQCPLSARSGRTNEDDLQDREPFCSSRERSDQSIKNNEPDIKWKWA